MAKHFIKTVLIFSGMIVLGLLGVYLVSHFDKEVSSIDISGNKTQVAK